jgi:hypothetical protein
MPSLPRRKSRKRTTIRGRKRTRRSRGGARGIGQNAPASAASSSYNEHNYDTLILSPQNEEHMKAFKNQIPVPGTFGRNENDIYGVIAGLQGGIADLSVDIDTVYHEIGEGISEDDLRYKKVYIRRGLTVLKELADSFYSIINNHKGYNDPEFKEFAIGRVEAVKEDMARIYRIKNALRSGW